MKFDRTALKAADRLWLAKFILRSLTTVCALIAVGTFAAVVARFNYSSDGDYYYAPAGFFTVFTFIPLGITLIWYIASTIHLFLKSHPIHPGWHVGFDLILFLGYIVFGIFVGADAILLYSDYGNSTYPDTYGYYDQPEPLDAGPFYRSLAQIELTGWIMLVLLIVLHFTLFVWACVDTEHHRRRKAATGMADEMIKIMRERGELPPAQQPLLTPGGAPLPASPYRPYQDNSSTSGTPHIQHDEHMSGGLARPPHESEMSA